MDMSPISLRSIFVAVVLAVSSVGVVAQTMDCKALASFSPAVQRAAYDVCGRVSLDAARQVEIARMIEKADAMFVKLIAADNGVLSAKSRNQLDRFRAKELKRILSADELMQYYRGVYDDEADAETSAIADRLQRKYGLTDQNWKFIRVALYKIALDSRMLRKVYADQPKVAARKIDELRETQLRSITEKGGIEVDPEEMTVRVVRPFDPNSLHRE